LIFCRYVRPGGGYVPNFQLFEKGDVNGDKEQKIFTFLKVSELVAYASSFSPILLLFVFCFFFEIGSRLALNSL
jgi:hypothetical protein